MTETEEIRRSRADMETKLAAQAMQRKLLDQIAELEAEKTSLIDELKALKADHDAVLHQARGWPWALEQLAAGHKVTHPILTTDPDRPGWIEKIGAGPKGNIYEIHESYCYSRALESENAWQGLVNQARKSVGWAVLPPSQAG